MAKFIANIDVSGTAKADIFIGYKDTLTLSISFRNTTTGDVLDISESELKLNVNSFNGKPVFSITATIEDNTATFNFDAAFWAKIKNNPYDYTITKTDGDATRTIMAGQLKPGVIPVSGGCACACDGLTVDGVTQYTIEVTIGGTGTGWDWQYADVVEATTITHATLGKDIGPIIYINATPKDRTTEGIEHVKEDSTLDFTDYGYTVTGRVWWQYKTA